MRHTIFVLLASLAIVGFVIVTGMVTFALIVLAFCLVAWLKGSE